MKNRNSNGGIRTFIPNGSKTEKNKINSPWYLKIYELVDLLDTNTEKGLSLQDAQKRRKKSGLNLLYPEFKRTFHLAFTDHIKAVSSVLLAISLFVYFAFFKEPEYLISAAIITFSILLDCILEHTSSIKMKLSRKDASLKTLVKRGGSLYSVDSRYLVPGDIVYIKKGSIVPADIRLFDSNGLTVFETPINGVEAPIVKIAKDIYDEQDYTKETPVNMAFAGSIVTEGSAQGIVCFTGRQTKFTNVPKNRHDNVPSSFKYIYSVSSMLSIVSAFVGAIMLVGGLFFSSSLSNSFLFALTIASCSLCDSVVSFSALSFSIGISEMKKNGAILRNLSSIESLSFIDSCLAHQNTLFPIQKTEVEKTFLGQHQIEGEYQKKLIKYFLLCSDVNKNLLKKEKNLSSFYGKQNAVAAAVYGEQIGVNIDSYQNEFLVTEIQDIENDEFSSLLAYENGQKYLIVKGKAKDVLPLCKYHSTTLGIKSLSEQDVSDYEDFISYHTSDTGYLIAIAKCETALDKLSDYDNRKVLTLCGFIRFKTFFGIDYFKDISESQKASIEVCMFSSDSYMKAYNLGKNSGIFQKNNQIISEEELKYITKEELEMNLPSYRLFLNFSSTLMNKIALFKRQKGKIVAVSAETTDDLLTMKNCNVSFVVDGESSEMIKQSSDVILESGGFDKINNLIFTSKKIYRRIHSLCEYSVYNYISLLFLYIFGTLLGIKYRVHDFLVFSFVVSGIIRLFLSTVPIDRKNNFDKPLKRKKTVSPPSFVNSFLLGVLCSLCCVILGALNKESSSYTATLISYSAFSLFTSFVILNEGQGVFKKHLGLNVAFVISAVVLSLVILAVIFLPFLSNSLFYSRISIYPALASMIVPIIVSISYPYLIFFFKHKKFKSSK